MKPIRFKDKRAGHVGMILSFVIFVTFVVFLYTITEPATRVERGKQDLLAYLEIELINYLSDDMTTSSINASIADSCIKVDIVPGTEEMNIVARTDEEILEHKKQGDDIIIDRKDNDFFRVYYSNSFENTEVETPCPNPASLPLAPGWDENRDYTVGLVRTTQNIFEKKINDTINGFEGNYSSLKESFGIAPGSEFGFEFEDSEGNTIGTEEKNVSVNIYVEEIPIQYVNSEAHIKSGFLRIRVW